MSAAREPRAATPWPAYATASIAWHAGAVGALLAMPEAWPWALGAVAANHLVLTAGGLWPRSRWLGSNWTRLPAAASARREVAITIDDGPDPAVTPAVLDLLDRHRATATFFCIAAQARAHAALCREIVARGHSVQNHSDRHAHNFSLLGPRAIARELAAAQDSLADLSGERPRFFRAPAGLRNPFLAPILQRLDLQLVSWTRRGFDTVRRDPDAMLTRLTRRLAPGDILLAHDGHAARTSDDVPLVIAVLPALLERIRALELVPVTLPAAADAESISSAAATP
ncbi:MAG TPA: polysaccharide deacetylase family protein [Caldimonas sp.]|nr:polysaccharide deacetylase family protein [Caldimonas sp.]HEX4234308.1 polysaccharide deacetylase family protein [Caldimonas sp.]